METEREVTYFFNIRTHQNKIAYYASFSKDTAYKTSRLKVEFV